MYIGVVNVEGIKKICMNIGFLQDYIVSIVSSMDFMMIRVTVLEDENDC